MSRKESAASPPPSNTAKKFSGNLTLPQNNQPKKHEPTTHPNRYRNANGRRLLRLAPTTRRRRHPSGRRPPHGPHRSSLKAFSFRNRVLQIVLRADAQRVSTEVLVPRISLPPRIRFTDNNFRLFQFNPDRFPPNVLPISTKMLVNRMRPIPPNLFQPVDRKSV